LFLLQPSTSYKYCTECTWTVLQSMPVLRLYTRARVCTVGTVSTDDSYSISCLACVHAWIKENVQSVQYVHEVQSTTGPPKFAYVFRKLAPKFTRRRGFCYDPRITKSRPKSPGYDRNIPILAPWTRKSLRNVRRLVQGSCDRIRGTLQFIQEFGLRRIDRFQIPMSLFQATRGHLIPGYDSSQRYHFQIPKILVMNRHGPILLAMIRHAPSQKEREGICALPVRFA
jgi:hypothetical protein